MKNKIFYFIIGALIFGSIGVYASYKYNAKDVSYSDTNVENAVNDLYSKMENRGFDNFKPLDSTLYEYNGSSKMLTLNTGLKMGTYLVISGGNVGGGGYTSFTPSSSSSQDVIFTTPIGCSDGTCFIIKIKKDLTSSITISGSASGTGVYLSVFQNY